MRLSIVILFCRIGILFFANIANPALAAPNQIETSLSRSEDFYVRGNFSAAELEIAGLIKNEDALSQANKARLYLLQARLEFVFNEGTNALPILEKLHAVQPDAELDPVKDPPLALKMWSDIKGREKQTTKEAASPTVPSPGSAATGTDKIATTTNGHHTSTAPATSASVWERQRWAHYALYAIPLGIAVAARRQETRFVAFGFIGGVLTVDIWHHHSRKQRRAARLQLDGGIDMKTRRHGLGIAGVIAY